MFGMVSRKEFEELQAEVERQRQALRMLQMWAIGVCEKQGWSMPPTTNLGGSPPPPRGP